MQVNLQTASESLATSFRAGQSEGSTPDPRALRRDGWMRVHLVAGPFGAIVDDAYT